jgi:tetratricopeptide (TPR) repeat protein
VILLLLAGSAAAITPAEKLDEARMLFRSGQYGNAAAMLAGLLYPSPELSDTSDLAEAHLLLGLCYFEIGQGEKAEIEVEEALAIEPALRIDDNRGYSRRAIEFFEEKRKELEKRALEQAKLRERARIRQRLRETPALEKNQYWLNFMPFGMGQLQNKDKRKAIFFFASQASLLAISLGLYVYQIFEYPEGTVPAEEFTTVETLQIIQITSGALWWGLYGWGVIDSITHYRPEPRRQLTDEEIERLMEEGDEEESAAIRLTPTVMPTLFPHGAGVALQWEF